MQALAARAWGDADAALDRLAARWTLAEPGGFVRTFLDLGAPLAALLRDLAARRPPSAYLARLLAALERRRRRPPAPAAAAGAGARRRARRRHARRPAGPRPARGPRPGAGAGRDPDRARGPGPRAPRPPPVQQGDRRRAEHLAADGQAPRQQPVRQARRRHAPPGGRHRRRARPHPRAPALVTATRRGAVRRPGRGRWPAAPRVILLWTAPGDVTAARAGLSSP